MTDYDYAAAFRSGAAAARYDESVYAQDSQDSAAHAALVPLLHDIVRRRFAGGEVTVHDFACGTGRILAALEDVATVAHGYDTSPDMLERARVRVPAAALHLVATDGPVPTAAATRGAPLVTCFRLILNAPHDVRDRAVAFAAAVLRDSPHQGVLVLDNHGNRRSLRQLAARRRHDEWFNSLSVQEVRDLLTPHGLQITEVHGLGVLPRIAYRHPRLRAAAARVDAWAARRPALSAVSVDQVYVVEAVR